MTTLDVGTEARSDHRASEQPEGEASAGHPLKVLVVTPSFGTFGGIQAVMLELARAHQADPAVEVTLCFKRVEGCRFDASLTDTVAESGARAIYVDRASSALLRAIRHADVVHLQTPSIDVAVMTRLLRRSLVITIYNWRRPGRGPRDIALLLASRLAHRRTYISNFVMSTWEPRGRREGSQRLPVVSTLPEGSVPVPERQGFLFIARFIPGKGLDVLLDAYAAADLDRTRWPLTLVGDGPIKPALEQRIEREKIEGVQILGFVDESTKHALIRRAKWMVTPPHHGEDLGLTPIEARNVGVPSIVTRDGGLLEAAGNFCLSCEPRHAEQLKALLEHAASMPDDYYARFADASQRELGSFLRPMSVYADLYREVVGARV